MANPRPEHDFSLLDLPPLGRPSLSHRRPAHVPDYWFGVCYYPEHWRPEERRDDPRRIAQAGFNVVRMGEFAWDVFEPRPGSYAFDLFDETIARLGDVGVRTILGTPTASPPRWLTDKLPDVHAVDATGRCMSHGSRQHASLCHPAYREHSRQVTQALAEHYRDNPNVIAWQTDNEFFCHFREDYSEAARLSFVEWCRRAYGGEIGQLNDAWGTRFWAQTYDSFEQLVLPADRSPTHLNPAHRLAYARFLSDAVTRFQREQVQILRRANPNWTVFHNGLFGGIDVRGAFGRDLDVFGFDVYPMFQKDPVRRPLAAAFNHDRCRAFAGNFIVPEHQAGAGGQTTYLHDNPEPGETRLLSWQSISRGADGLLYFRWRTARKGAEQYWMGLLDHDDVGRRPLAEATQLAQELKTAGPRLLGTRVRVEAAVATSDADVRAAHAACTLGLPDPDHVAEHVHGVLLQAGLAAGCVHPADDLAGIKLYVIPHWAYFDPAWLPNLQRWVEQGGTLVVGARTATRDTQNNIPPVTPPGCLTELCGIRVAEWSRINDASLRPKGIEPDAGFAAGRIAEAHTWYEALEPSPGTEVLARWTGRHLAGQPAVTVRSFGRGRVVYVGTYLSAPAAEALLPGIVALAGVEPLLPGAPAGLQACVREADDGRRFWFLLNPTDESLTVERGLAGMAALVGPAPAAGGALTLGPMAVAVLEASSER